MLKHLVLHRHRPVPREVLMEAFWPDAWPAAARNNLHGAVHALRRFLREVHGDVEHIVFEDGCYALAPELEMWDDVSEFERLARRRAAPSPASRRRCSRPRTSSTPAPSSTTTRTRSGCSRAGAVPGLVVALRSALGATPSEDTVALVDRIRRRDIQPAPSAG
jgi:hypothetical protein